MRDPAPFRATLRTLTGARAARVLTVAVPVAEALLAGALIAGVAGRPVALAVLALMLAFTAVLGRLERGRATASARAATCARRPRAPATCCSRPARSRWSCARRALWDVAGDMLAAATVAVGLVCVWRLSPRSCGRPLAPDPSHPPTITSFGSTDTMS